MKYINNFTNVMATLILQSVTPALAKRLLSVELEQKEVSTLLLNKGKESDKICWGEQNYEFHCYSHAFNCQPTHTHTCTFISE